MSILSTILCIAKQNKVKIYIYIYIWNRLKFKTIFFYIYPQFSRAEFSNNLIASDLLRFLIIQR